MDIVLIRHGQSEGNLLKTYAYDHTPLTDLGIQQARATRARVEKLGIERVYISPFLRAQETARHLGLKGETIEDIREIDFGLLRGQSYGAFVDSYPEENKRWLSDPINNSFPGGESLIQVYERVGNFLELLRSRNEDAILVCHDGAIKGALAYIIGDPEIFLKLKLENVSLSKIVLGPDYELIEYINRIYY